MEAHSFDDVDFENLDEEKMALLTKNYSRFLRRNWKKSNAFNMGKTSQVKTILEISILVASQRSFKRKMRKRVKEFSVENVKDMGTSKQNVLTP